MVQRCEFALFVYCQSKQVNVRDLSMGDDRIGFEDLKNADVIRPEVMPRSLTEATKKVKHGRHVPRPVWVIWVAGNSNKSIFGESTRRPYAATRCKNQLWAGSW